ncbi:MAG: hypothetical protein KDA24_08265 [Deltaproteobacteria bacterium]|nr:hypothetical protein [Deltaproteobacteria bacterium]
MGRKKKIRSLLDAVGHLFEERPKKKALRRAAAFREFLDQLRRRRAELDAQAAEAGEGQQANDLREDLAVLDDEIHKAERLLSKLEADEGDR